MRRGIWHGYFTAWEPVMALVGKMVGIAELGNIGLHIAKVCKALSMTVLGLKSTPGSAPSADVDALYTLLAGYVHFFVLALVIEVAVTSRICFPKREYNMDAEAVSVIGGIAMAVYIGTVPPVGWEKVWDKAAQRAGYTGPLPQVITDATVLAQHGEDIGALVARTVTPELLTAAPHLKLVQVPFAGVDSFDLATLKRAGVPLANSHGNREVTAEHAIALMFALARRIIPYDRDLRQGIWHGFTTMDEPIIGLFGKTVGIAGLGNIGGHILRICRAMDMKVLGLKRTPGGACSDLVDRAYGTDEKMEFLQASDFVIDVLPLTTETENFFGKAEFEAMRGHWFINIGRGGTVDEKALYEALKDGTLAGAGIDPWWVYPSQPVAKDPVTGRMLHPVFPAHEPFWELPNVVMSPHTGGFADVSVDGLWGEAFENAIRADRGETPRNLVDLERGY